MFLKQLLNYLLVLALIYLPDTGAQTNISAFKGDSVHLPCVYDRNSTKISVEWRQNNANGTVICQHQIDHQTRITSGNCSSPYTFNFKSLELNIKNAQLSDSGRYNCKWSRIIPPPTWDKIKDVMLLVSDLSLHRLNSSNVSCIHLLCSLENLNPEQVNFTWSREGQTLPNLSSSLTSSELWLCKPAWNDKDMITCQADYFYNNILYNRTAHFKLSTEDAFIWNIWLLIIICSSAAAGVIFSLIFTAVICKCRKRRNASESIVFNNKVYENFSFAVTRESTQRTQPTVNPRIEECVYEN